MPFFVMLATASIRDLQLGLDPKRPKHKKFTASIAILALFSSYLTFMSSSPSNPPSPPPTNSQLQLEHTHTPEANSQNGHHKVNFGEVLHYWWANAYHQSNSSSSINNNSPTPLQIWVIQNVYPIMTPLRIFFYSISLISSLLAYGSFMQTEFYKSSHRQLFFMTALIGHNVWLIFLLFFRFCSVGRHHYVLKSLGDLVVLLLVSFLMLGIGPKHNHLSDEIAAAPVGSLKYGKVEASEVAALATCVFLDIDALCIINLLMPGHHYSLFEAIVTLTLHLSLMGGPYLSISAVCFIFVVLVIKNFLWRHEGDAEAPTNELHHLAWVAHDVV